MSTYTAPIKVGFARRSDTEKHNFTAILDVAQLEAAIKKAKANPLPNKPPAVVLWAQMTAIRAIADGSGNGADLNLVDPTTLPRKPGQ